MPEPIYVNQFDDATFRIGLAWLARKSGEGATIEGIKECTSYLRKLVDAIWQQMKSLLSTLNRDATVQMLLENHESLEDDSEHWNRTFRAVMGLHKDIENVFSVVSEQIMLRNAGSIGSRLALEMAICECDKNEGYKPGKLDISKLIAYASMLFHIGGWSDGIRYEMTPATIRLSPTGDVLFDHTFSDQIMFPYGHALQGGMLKSSAKNYSEYYKIPQVVKSTAGLFEKEFENAWLAEYGFTIDEGRKLLDAIEDEGFKHKKATFTLVEEDFINICVTAGLSLESTQAFVNSLSLEARNSWSVVPEGFNNNDIMPWRFRRRLSAISRPIIKIEDKLFLTPGFIRDGFVYLMRNCYDASFEDSQFKTKEMRSWIGGKRNVAGHKLNKDVADEFKNNGWEAESDVLLTQLLNKKLDKNYGDVDVVAWKPETSEVFLIECKDLAMAKTPGEAARQMYEFRGVVRENGKPDRLLKHMERIRILNDNRATLGKHMKLKLPIILRPCLLFNNIVPMKFASKDNFKDIMIVTFDDIGDFVSENNSGR